MNSKIHIYADITDEELMVYVGKHLSELPKKYMITTYTTNNSEFRIDSNIYPSGLIKIIAERVK